MASNVDGGRIMNAIREDILDRDQARTEDVNSLNVPLAKKKEQTHVELYNTKKGTPPSLSNSDSYSGSSYSEDGESDYFSELCDIDEKGPYKFYNQFISDLFKYRTNIKTLDVNSDYLELIISLVDRKTKHEIEDYLFDTKKRFEYGYPDGNYLYGKYPKYDQELTDALYSNPDINILVNPEYIEKHQDLYFSDINTYFEEEKNVYQKYGDEFVKLPKMETNEYLFDTLSKYPEKETLERIKWNLFKIMYPYEINYNRIRLILFENNTEPGKLWWQIMFKRQENLYESLKNIRDDIVMTKINDYIEKIKVMMSNREDNTDSHYIFEKTTLVNGDWNNTYLDCHNKIYCRRIERLQKYFTPEKPYICCCTKSLCNDKIIYVSDRVREKGTELSYLIQLLPFIVANMLTLIIDSNSVTTTDFWITALEVNGLLIFSLGVLKIFWRVLLYCKPDNDIVYRPFYCVHPRCKDFIGFMACFLLRESNPCTEPYTFV